MKSDRVFFPPSARQFIFEPMTLFYIPYIMRIIRESHNAYNFILYVLSTYIFSNIKFLQHYILIIDLLVGAVI